MLTYEAELTWEPTACCFGWSWVTYRHEGDECNVVACGSGYGTREYALELALTAAEKDRSTRMFDPWTGKSFNVILGTNPGTKTREMVNLDV